MILKDLNKEENSFSKLTENLPGIIYRVLIEDDNRMIFFNDMVQTMTGYSPEELKRGEVYSIDPLILLEDRLNVINIIKDSIENNVPFEVEYRINNKNGEVKWFSERGRPIRGDNGNPSHIDGVIFDVTKLKEAWKKLKTSEKKFKTIFDGSPIGIELYDSNGKLVDINEKCLDIFGLSSIDDVAGFKLFKDPNIPKEQLKKLKKGQIIKHEFLFDFDLVKDLNLYKTKKSGKIWIDVLISPLYLEENNTISNYLVQLQEITERKITEQKLKVLNEDLDKKIHERTKQLKKSEEQHKILGVELETILDHYPGLAFYKDTNNNFIRINQNVVDYYNCDTASVKVDLTKKDIEGKNLSNLLPKDIAQAYWDEDLEVINSGTPKLNIEVSFKTEHGIKWLKSNKIPYFDEDGKIRGIIGFSIDITERKKAELKLKKSEEKYRLITENMNDLISVTDQNMNFEFVNEKAFLNILGRSKEEMIGKDALSWVHPKDAEKIIEAFKIGFETGEGRIEARFKDKKGIYHWFEIKGKTFIDHDGKKKALMISRDTTQHKKAEQKIIHEREKANLYLNVVEVILIALDRDGKITLLNKKGHELLGYDNGELIGKNWFEVCLPPHNRERVYEYFKKLMAGEMESNLTYENPIWEKTGEERLISWSTVLFKDENGTITGLLSSGEDITERAIAEKKLIESETSYKHLSNELEVILDHIPALVFYKNTQNKFLRVNKLVADAYNLSKEELVGKSLFDLYTKEDAQTYWDNDLEVIASGKPKLDFEEPWETAIGKRWVSTSKIPNINKEGDITGIIGFSRDITEQKKVEEKFRKQNVFLNNIIESLTHPFYVINVKDYTVALANSAASSEGLEHGQYCYSLTHGNNKPCETPCMCPLNEVKKSKRACVVEHIHYDKEGNEKIYEIYGYPILDESGNVVQMIEYSLNISDRKKAENNLRKIAHQWRTTFDAMSECVFLLDLESNILQCNQVTLEFLGKKDYDEIIGHSYLEIIHGSSTLEDRCPMMRMLESNKAETSIAQIENKWCEISANPVINDEGSLIGAVQIITDITERRKTEAALRESEERFRNLIEQSVDGVLLVDEKGLIIEWNRGQEQITGLKKEDVVGRPIWDVQSQTDPEQDKSLEKHDRIKGMIKDALKTGDAQWIGKLRDINIQRVDNKEIRAHQQLTFLIKTENSIMLGNISRDITERKKAEQELIESEEKFRTIAERALMGIVIVQNNQIKYINDALLNMIEYSQIEIAEWEMDDLTKLIHPEDITFLREYRMHLRSGDKSLKPYYSYRVLTKLGKVKWIDQSSKDICYKGRSAELFTIMDITEKKKVELELIKLNNLKSELLRRTSHELKTPLVSIKGFSDLLLELHRDKLDDYVIKTIEQIKGGCSRLESLVNDILKTTELESGTVEFNKSKEDLSLLIKICVSELEGMSELRNHTINLEIPDKLIYSFEKEQIYNVISNILINAIKFTPSNGKIEVKSEIIKDFIMVSIKDNGIGFTEEEKTQIFKQFGKIERYGQGYDVISEGSGLGLYISKKIIELHGGKIWVESEGRNKGSTFIVSLPMNGN